MTRSRSNSRSSRSWMISRCSRPEEAAAEAEAQGRAALRLVLEAGIVEAQLAQAVAQVAVVVGVGRVHAAEHDRLARAEARQRAVGRLAVVGDGVADPGVADLLDGGGDEADLARPQRVDQQRLGREDARRGRAGATAPVPMKRTFWPFCSVPCLTRIRVTTPR